MNWGTVRTVLAKELKETLRDRRTLFMMLLLPTLLYPVLLIVVEQLALFGERRLAERPPAVAVAGADPALQAFLRADSSLRLASADSATAEAVRAGAVQAAVVVSPAAGEGTQAVRILFDASDDRSQRARERVGVRLDAWGDTLLARRLLSRGLPATFAAPVAVADSSVATAREAGGYALGRFLPAILVLMTLLGTFYPAIDLAAGEKERGTLETLLTAPVPPREIVAGKFAAVAVMGIAAAVANLLSMLLTFQSGVFRLARAAGLEFTLPWGSALLVLAGLVPLAILFAAVFLGIAVRSQSFKEAQNALTPVQLASILPILLISLPGIDFTPVLAAVPVAGIALLFRELMGGTAGLVPSLVAFGSTVLYAWLALVFAARAFGREDVLFGSPGASSKAAAGGMGERLRAWREGPRRVPLPAEGFAFIAGVALLFFYVGAALQGTMGERGLLLSEWLLLGGAAVAFAVLGPYDARETLALRAPSPRALLAAVLVVAGAIPVGLLIGWLQLRFLNFDTESLQGLEALVTATDLRRALWLLFLVAITPAVCEELVFRGVLMGSLSREMNAWRSVLISAAVFGAFHLSFETAIRFLPTAWLGVVMGIVAWHTRSIFASMLMHFLNNGLVVLLLWQPGVRRMVLVGERPSWIVVALAPLLLAAGLWLLPRRSTAPSDPAPALDAVPDVSRRV